MGNFMGPSSVYFPQPTLNYIYYTIFTKLFYLPMNLYMNLLNLTNLELFYSNQMN